MEYALLVRWLFIYAALAACGLPLCAMLFPRLPDRGAAFAVPIALASLTLPVYWLGHVALGPLTFAVAVGLLVGGAAASARRVSVPWLAGLEAYLIFAAAVVLYVHHWTGTPAITPLGGEDFLHFGLLNAVLRADSLPPEDVWFAGEAVRYYYGGHLMTAALATLTGTEARYAYNLAMAGYFGVLVVAAYGVGGALAANADRPRRAGGLLAVYLVAFAGYLVTAVRFAFGRLPEDVALRYGEPVFGAIRHRDYEEAVLTQSTTDGWLWFHERYVIEGALTEFPMYSFVKGDHHGHTITTGFLVVAAALAYAYYLTPAGERRRRLALLFGVIPAFAGLLGVMNAWVLPSVVGLTWLALVFAPIHPATVVGSPHFQGRSVGDAFDARSHLGRVADDLWRVATATGLAAVVGALAVAWGAPFLVFGTPTNDGVGLFPPRTSGTGLLLLYGAILTLFAAYLLDSWVKWFREWAPGQSGRTVGRVAIVAVAAVLAVGVVAVALPFPALALVGLPMAAAWLLLRADDGTDVDFETVLLVGGLGLVLATELVHARVWPPDQPRWNTTLKVAVQAWTVCALAAAGVMVRWFGVGLEEVRDRVEPRAHARVGAVAVLCVAVVAASAPFAVLAFAPSVTEAPDSVDGLATYEGDETRADDLEAVAWLQERDGTRTLLEAPGRSAYRWQNPASTFTGHPAVVGWEHEQGYRGVEAFEARADDVDRAYTGEDREEVLERYDVDYVYVGPNERDRYGDSLVPFDGPAFRSAFENENVTIYEVDRDDLDGE